MIVYPDTSFLVPLYVLDSHTPNAQQRVNSGPSILIGPFHRAELTTAIYQHVFRRQISLDEAQAAVSAFEEDCRNGVLLRAAHPELAFHRCEEMAIRRVATLGVRTLDTLHVACALELKADRFWTYDERQRSLAESEGLNTA